MQAVPLSLLSYVIVNTKLHLFLHQLHLLVGVWGTSRKVEIPEIVEIYERVDISEIADISETVFISYIVEISEIIEIYEIVEISEIVETFYIVVKGPVSGFVGCQRWTAELKAIT